jgi:hypothetical protein
MSNLSRSSNEASAFASAASYTSDAQPPSHDIDINFISSLYPAISASAFRSPSFDPPPSFDSDTVATAHEIATDHEVSNTPASLSRGPGAPEEVELATLARAQASAHTRTCTGRGGGAAAQRDCSVAVSVSLIFALKNKSFV